MSNRIDDTVVSMQFDNRNFEQNIDKSMSTIDKLKQKLRFKGAEKGFNNISKAASNVSFKGMESEISGIQVKFSYMQMAIQHQLNRLVDSFVNAGLRIGKALTIDPIISGWDEYNLELRSVKTIMASTGDSIDVVNKQLAKLNKYSDDTIYSFADMTSNIGKFTNAGVKLNIAIPAMMGLSNEAALSGASAFEASRAMYNISQSLSMGYMQLIDWKSIENANMATVEFKTELMKTALEMKKVTKTADGMYQSINSKDKYNLQGMFKDGLKDRWLDNDVLLKTLQKYGDKTTDIGKKAWEAATSVDSISLMWQTLKEAAQSGWSKSWKIIMGDLLEARALLTPIKLAIERVIDAWSNARNAFLESAFGKTLASSLDNFKKLQNVVTKTSNLLSKFTKTEAEHRAVVAKVIQGQYKNTEVRWNRLTKEGYDWKYIQNLVNEELGFSLRRESEFGKAKAKTSKITAKNEEELKKELITLSKLTDEQLRAKGMTNVQIETLRALQKEAKKLGLDFGFFLNNINKINGRWLVFESLKNIGKTISNIFGAIGKGYKQAVRTISGDDMFSFFGALHKVTKKLVDYTSRNSDTLMRTFRGLFSIFDLIRKVVGIGLRLVVGILGAIFGITGNFSEVLLKVTAKIGDVIYAINQWINRNGYLTKAIGFVSRAVGGVIRSFIDWIKNNKTAGKISEWFLKIVDSVKNKMTALIVKFQKSGMSLRDVASRIWNYIKFVFDNIRKLLPSSVKAPFKNIYEYIVNFIDKFKSGELNFKQIGIYIVEGLKKGIDKVKNIIPQNLKDFGMKIINTFKQVLGIHSPSKVFMSLGYFIMAGLALGITGNTGLLTGALNYVKNVFISIFKFFKDIDFGKIAGLAFIGVFVMMSKAIYGFVQAGTTLLTLVGKGLKGLVDSIENITKLGANLGKAAKLAATSLLVTAITKLIWALVGSITVLALIPAKDSWNAVRVIATLLGSIVAFMASMVLISKSATVLKTGFDINNFKLLSFLGGIVLSLIGLSFIIKKFGKMKKEIFDNGLNRMLTILSSLVVFIYLYGSLTSKFNLGINKPNSDKNILALAKLISKIAIAFLIIAVAVRLIGSMKPDQLGIAIAAFSWFGLLVTGLLLISNLVNDQKKLYSISRFIQSIGISLILFAITFRMLGKMSWGALGKAIAAMVVFFGFITSLLLVVSRANKNVKSFGSNNSVEQTSQLIKNISVGIMLMAGSILILGNMNHRKMWKGITGIAGLFAIIGTFITYVNTTLNQKGIYRVGILVSLLTISMFMMAGIVLILGNMKVVALAKGLFAVAMLTQMVKELVKTSSRYPVRNLTAMWIIIGSITSLLIAVIAMSFIPFEKLALISVSIIGIILSISFMLKAISEVNIDKSTIKNIGLMIATYAIIVGGIWLLANLPIENLEKSISALILTLVSLVGAFAVIGLIGKIVSPTIMAKALVTFAIFVAGMVGIITGLTWLNDVMSNSGMDLLKGIELLGKIGLAIGEFIGGIIAGFAKQVISILPALGKTISDFGVNLEPLTTYLKTLDMSVLKGAGYLTAAVLAVLAMVLGTTFISFMTLGTGFVLAGKQLAAFGYEIEPFIEILKKFDNNSVRGANALTNVVLNIAAANILDTINKFLKGNSLKKFAKEVVAFGDEIVKFLDKIKDLSDKNVESVNVVSKIIDALASMTRALPAKGVIRELFTGSKDLKKFSESLPPFAENLNSFLNQIDSLTTNKIKSVEIAANILETLVDAIKEIPKTGGLIQLFEGEHDLSDISNILPDFGKNINSFMSNIKGFDSKYLKSAEIAGNILVGIIKSLGSIGDISKLLIPINGITSIFTKEKKVSILDLFNNIMPDITKAITIFIEDIKKNKLTNDGIKSATSAASLMATLFGSLATFSEAVKTRSGMFSSVLSKDILNEYKNFIGQFPTVAEATKEFIKSTSGLTEDNIKGAKNAISIIDEISKLRMPSIDYEVFDITKIVYDKNRRREIASRTLTKDIKQVSMNITEFIGIIEPLSIAAKTFVDNTQNFDKESVSKSKMISEMLSNLASVGQIKTGDLRVNIEEFSSFIPDLLANLKLMESYLSGKTLSLDAFILNGNIIEQSDPIEKLKKTLGSVISIIKSNIENIPYDKLKLFNEYTKNFTTTVESIIELGKNKITSSDTWGSVVSEMLDTLITNFKESKKDEDLTKTVRDLANHIISTFNSAINPVSIMGVSMGGAYGVGKNMVIGFVKGILENSKLAYDATYNLGLNSINYLKKGPEVKSPSRKAAEIGMHIVKGLSLGINTYSKEAYNSAYNTGNMAMDAIRDSIASLNKIVEDKIDSQPTIKPVLDLTDISRQTRELASMLNNVDARISINSIISNGVNTRQNGANRDILSALDKIKSVGNTNNTYNVNGITYDDGSNIQNAVQTLVRAANIRRRT